MAYRFGGAASAGALQPIMPKPLELALKEGDQAPDFSGATSQGPFSLSAARGRKVILFFYPRDDTPGCTKEACGFRDFHAEIAAKGAVVLGVSTDPVKSHAKFAEKFKLPFPLLADESQAVVNAYGVWGEKSFMGRKYMGTNRVTFLIDEQGRIAKIWPSVKPETHPAEVLAALG